MRSRTVFVALLLIALFAACHSGESKTAPVKNDPHPDSQKKIAHVYVPAEFPGGEKALREYFRKNVPCIDSIHLYGEHYVLPLPDELRFKIDTLGNVLDVGIVNATQLSTDKKRHEFCWEAIRNMPRWIPASNDGKKIISHAWISFRTSL